MGGMELMMEREMPAPSPEVVSHTVDEHSFGEGRKPGEGFCAEHDFLTRISVNLLYFISNMI